MAKSKWIKMGLRLVCLSVIVMLFNANCKQADQNPESGTEEDGVATFINPIIRARLPDPTVIRAADGWYYLYATEDTRNVPIWRSKDMVKWALIGTAFTDDSRPDFLEGGMIWAPEINYIDGQYVLHYSMSVWGQHWTAGIGVAVADKPEGPFKDLGKMFDSREIDVENSIDQFYATDDKGNGYLFWGSFHGIYAVALSDDGLSVKDKTEKARIAGDAYEGSAIFRRDNYYYYFGSVGTCCEGDNSTYHVVYGRSESILGPYKNKKGELLIDNKHEILIGNNSRFVGNGHNSRLVQDDADNDWMFYHGYEKGKSSQWDRYLMLSQVEWDDDGWPYVAGGSPQTAASPPVINEN